MIVVWYHVTTMARAPTTQPTTTARTSVSVRKALLAGIVKVSDGIIPLCVCIYIYENRLYNVQSLIGSVLDINLFDTLIFYIS